MMPVGVQRRLLKDDSAGRGRQVKVAGKVTPTSRRAETEKAWQFEAASRRTE